jgi:PBP1b-binding outer membrane lipoprotein LpoB
MKIKSIILAIALSATFVAGCTAGPYPRVTYEQSQFANRVEYLRFCQRYALDTHRCD